MDDRPSSLHQRRVENEWDLLQVLARQNPAVIALGEREHEGLDTIFPVVLHQTGGLLYREGEVRIERRHPARFRLPRFFPAVPIEVALETPVFHPNVDPKNGFVCLWSRFSPGDTVPEAVARLQAIIAWKLFNFDADHIMQPAAVAWYNDGPRGIDLPLPYMSIEPLKGFELERTSYQRRPGARHSRMTFRIRS